MIDIAALAEALAKDPNALSALVNGPDGELIIDSDAAVAAPQDAGAIDPPRATDAVEAAHLARQLRILQLLGSLPPTSRARLELLV